MDAINLIEIIKRHFGLLVGIPILYACENTVSHSQGNCVTNKCCVVLAQ